MGKLSIKIKIWDREYPMKVEADEEYRLRNAGKIINEKIKAYRDQFGIDDKQDLLAMVAFDCLVERLKLEEINHVTTGQTLERLRSMNNIISQLSDTA